MSMPPFLPARYQRFRHHEMEGPVIVVVFEVWPAQGRKDDYLGIAAALRADLDRIDGFISIERFQSLSDPEKILSLSFWRDEEAVKNWRNHSKHRMSQAKGRAGRRRGIACVWPECSAARGIFKLDPASQRANGDRAL